MKRLMICSIAVLFPITVATPAAAAFRHFSNCTQMHATYKGGVAKPGAKNKGGKTHYKPYYNLGLYNANKNLDRDHDGIACER